ncbi:hypothetical protein HDU67_003145, partial [Dinochytrium kinnereticum]
NKPLYKMCGHISTVVDVWKEFEEGKGGSLPLSVLLKDNSLLSVLGDRKENAGNHRTYQRRNAVVNLVRDTANQMGIAGARVAEGIERVRREEHIALLKVDAVFKADDASFLNKIRFHLAR